MGAVKLSMQNNVDIEAMKAENPKGSYTQQIWEIF